MSIERRSMSGGEKDDDEEEGAEAEEEEEEGEVGLVATGGQAAVGSEGGGAGSRMVDWRRIA